MYKYCMASVLRALSEYQGGNSNNCGVMLYTGHFHRLHKQLKNLLWQLFSLSDVNGFNISSSKVDDLHAKLSEHSAGRCNWGN